MTDHTPTPWAYRPHEHDDWGWIRGQPKEGETIGQIVATARGNSHDATDWDEHRRNKTDPFEPNAAFIVKAVNNHDALTEMVKLQGQEIGITRERDEALTEALEKIAAMDPFGVRADDLGRAARVAREALGSVGKPAHD